MEPGEGIFTPILQVKELIQRIDSVLVTKFRGGPALIHTEESTVTSVVLLVVLPHSTIIEHKLKSTAS